MAHIARFTTPAFQYKPSAVPVSDITRIVFTLKQGGDVLIRKEINDATVSGDGFTWILSQSESQILASRKTAIAQIDYVTVGGLRYTTMPKTYEIAESAINEVL